MSIKVFQINDCDWFAGEDLESCIKAYFTDYLTEEDTPENRDEFIDDPYELADEQLDKLQYHSDTGVMTFREALNEMVADTDQKFPCLFATTEY